MEIYPDKYQFNKGDFSSFLICPLESAMSLQELRECVRRKMFDLSKTTINVATRAATKQTFDVIAKTGGDWQHASTNGISDYKLDVKNMIDNPEYIPPPEPDGRGI